MECSSCALPWDLFIHSVCISLHLRERDGESLRHFSKNMFKYLLHFPAFQKILYVFLFSLPFNNVSWGYLQIKTFTALFLCFVKNTNFAQKEILILSHLSIRLDTFVIPYILSIRKEGATRPVSWSKPYSTWSLVSDMHTHTHHHTSLSIAQITWTLFSAVITWD